MFDNTLEGTELPQERAEIKAPDQTAAFRLEKGSVHLNKLGQIQSL